MSGEKTAPQSEKSDGKKKQAGGKQKRKISAASKLPAEQLDYSGALASINIDNGVTLDRFREQFHVEVVSMSGDDMVFDMIGIDAALANAFRRVLIAEVPTMAIEKVFIANNTSLVQDEVLAHRLGLVPLRVDPRNFEFPSGDGMASESNTLVYKVDFKCTRNTPQDGSKHGSMLSKHLTWLPQGSEYPPNQSSKYTNFSHSQADVAALRDNPPEPVHADIVLARLRPGQAIELEAHAVKGLGREHAKWSPVSTASYRMLPQVVFKKAVEGEKARELVNKCPVNVFDIEDMGNGLVRATAPRARACTVCRECIREEGWEDYILLKRKTDHFIFSIESSGALPPQVLFTEAVRILQDKANRLAAELDRD